MIMDTGTIAIIVSIVGGVLGALGFARNAKKDSNEQVEQEAYFKGVVTEKLDRLSEDVKALKELLEGVSTEYRAEIARQIKEHERRFHNG